jgi:hypothetical protein
VLESWPLLARARSDVPAQRPGWGNNLTDDRARRAEFEAEEAAAAGRPAPRRETVIERGRRELAGRPPARHPAPTPAGLRDFLLARRDELREQRSHDPERARLARGDG